MLRVAPRRATAILSARGRDFAHRQLKRWGTHAINQKLLTSLGDRVIAGPFAGLRLSPMTHDDHIGPYLLGTYEQELHPWWEQLLAIRYDQIIDVGCKFGYYAVGLALKYPQAQVVAFDTDHWARKATEEMTLLNRATNVQALGFCD